jgi:CBS domain-containing protein
MKLREIMKTGVVTAEPREPANVAWSRMRARRIRHLVVTDNTRVVGVVSESDLGGLDGPDVRSGRVVADLMTRPVVRVEPGTTLRRAAALMRDRLIGSLPVLDDGRLVGIVTATDILEALGRTATQPAVRTHLGASGPDHGGRRGRARMPYSRDRAPFPDRLPRAFRREAGRLEAPLVPTHIHIRGVVLAPGNRSYIRRKLGLKLGKFATSIQRVSVRLEDVNGPRAGVDQICRIKVVLHGLPSVVVERQDAVLEAAIDIALVKVERAVRRVVQRRRMKPSKHRSRHA